jgi:hypothetical protein
MDRELFEMWRDHFLKTPDYQSWLWVLSHDKKSSVLVGDQDFRGNDASGWWITVIDAYRGREPIRCDYDFFRYGRGSIFMYPMVMLDSQVVDALYRYIAAPDKMDISRRKSVHKFLVFIMSHNFDYSPFFYYLEKSAKSSADTYEPFATERAKMIFTLQTMDREQFLEKGEIVHDSKQVSWYLEDRGVKSIEELISLYAAKREHILESGLISLADNIYATLLRIVLAECQVNGSIREKHRVVREFMGEILGAVLGEELYLALIYFAQPGRYSRFIPLLQRGMNFKNLCRTLRGSAWDLILIRLPWLVLSTNMVLGTDKCPVMSYPCCLTYICTVEHAIRDIMKLQEIEVVFEERGKNYGIRPVITYDAQGLNAIIGEKMVGELLRDFFTWRTSRTLDVNLKRPLSSSGLSNVITILEGEVARICEQGV